jgi:hypothetical protein
MPRLAAAFLLSAVSAQNMLGDQPYLIANAIPGHESRKETFVGEHFTVYSPPLTSKYSQVFWKSMSPVALPKEIVQRFANSTIAITGWEVDVVRRTNASKRHQDIHHDDGNDQSVPCYESYNHHYGANIKGKGLRMLDTTGLFPSHGAGGDQIKFVREDGYESQRLQSGEPIPGVQSFNEHNGNEARQSYHGLPALNSKQNVQPLFAPETFIMSPMQINTKNPDKKKWPGPRGGPLPRSSSAPPNATYSGILECPCTSRITKDLSGHVTLNKGQCTFGDSVMTAAECFAAANTLGMAPVIANKTMIKNASAPAGCFSVRQLRGFEVVFNDIQNASKADGCVYEADTDYNHGADCPEASADTKEDCCKMCQERDGCAGSTFYKKKCFFKSESDFNPSKRTPYPGATACRANKTHNNYMSFSSSSYTSPHLQISGVECGGGGNGVVTGEISATESAVSLLFSSDANNKNVTMTLSGPSGAWFGVGLNASSMMDRPYALIVDGSGGVSERRLGMAGSQNGHDAGKALVNSVHVLRMSVQGNRRTVTLTRAITGATADHFSFPADLTSSGGQLPVISAHGTTQTLAQHQPKAFSSSVLTLVRAGSSTCICKGGTGKINGVPYKPHCIPYPKSSMLPQHNPTCDVSTVSIISYPGSCFSFIS